MCEYCLQSECPVSCPNYEEPPAPFNCDGCEEGIGLGEDYVEIDGKRYCEECISGSWRIADEDDYTHPPSRDDFMDEYEERSINA
jgi:hypothetical protein